MAIRTIIDRWLKTGCPLSPSEITLVFHTSCVNFQDEDLDYLSCRGMRWCVPDNVRVELSLLQENGCEFGESRFSRRAGRILANAEACGMLGLTEEGLRWDLEQLYEGPGRGSADRRLIRCRTMLFLFGNRYKLYEFLEYAADLPDHYVLMLHEGEWSCARGRVTSLRSEQAALRRQAKAFWSGSECMPVNAVVKTCKREQLRRIKLHNSRGEDMLRGPGIPGRILTRKVGIGSYAEIYHTPRELGEGLVKLYRGRSLVDNGADKLRALAACAADMGHLPLAMPRLLMMWSDSGSDLRVIGYTMKALDGQPASRITLRNWPAGTDPKRILHRIGSLLVEVHTRGMLVNDLSYYNVLVADSGTVGFVDCDSFQIRGYPGGLITPIYRHPDVCEEECEQTLRKPIHEYFAFTVLMYQLIIGIIDPLNALKTESDQKRDWGNTEFPLEWNTISTSLVGSGILSQWVIQDEPTRRLFADVFHFRSCPSIGAVLRELGLL